MRGSVVLSAFFFSSVGPFFQPFGNGVVTTGDALWNELQIRIRRR